MFELNAATGAPVRSLTAPSYRFSNPVAVAANGAHARVVNDPYYGGGSVTELNDDTGKLARVLTAPRYGFYGPFAIAVDDARVWVANYDSNSVTEFPVSSSQPAPRRP